MAEEQKRREHPIIAGVVALVGVAVVVGLVLGGGALVAARALGLNDGSSSSSASSAKDTLYIPSPSAGDSTSSADVAIPSDSPSTDVPTDPSSSPADKGITLVAGETTVTPMGRIDLTGTYPGGDSAILQVQQFAEGQWTDFYAVSVPVSGEQFATYVQTGIAGKHRFRVLDPDTDAHSNPITVQVQ